jgi:hypothetical protein
MRHKAAAVTLRKREREEQEVVAEESVSAASSASSEQEEEEESSNHSASSSSSSSSNTEESEIEEEEDAQPQEEDDGEEDEVVAEEAEESSKPDDATSAADGPEKKRAKVSAVQIALQRAELIKRARAEIITLVQELAPQGALADKTLNMLVSIALEMYSSAFRETFSSEGGDRETRSRIAGVMDAVAATFLLCPREARPIARDALAHTTQRIARRSGEEKRAKLAACMGSAFARALEEPLPRQ